MNSITDNKLLDNELLDSLGVLKQIEEKDTKHLKDFLNKMETKASLTPYEDREENAYSNLYVITGLPVYIKSRYYNNGLQYLTAGGANKELFFSTIHLKSNANKFYIEKYAPSTGTGEFIFSMQTRTPIVLGYYTSNKDKSIAYPSSSSVPSYSADWSLVQTSTDEYVSIKNRSSIKAGPSGEYWDAYYEYMGVSSINRPDFGKYIKGNAKQEFKIELINGFTIDQIEFMNPYNTATIKTLDPLTITEHMSTMKINQNPMYQ